MRNRRDSTSSEEADCARHEFKLPYGKERREDRDLFLKIHLKLLGFFIVFDNFVVNYHGFLSSREVTASEIVDTKVTQFLHHTTSFL